MKNGVVVEVSHGEVSHVISDLREKCGVQKIIAFSGGADEKEEDVKHILEEALRKIQGLPIAILTGGSKWGIPEFASKIAKKYDLCSIGILPTTGKKHALPPSDFDVQIFVHPYYENSYWGDESPLFAKLADAIVVMGGGSGTLIEVAHAMKINEKLIKPDIERDPIYIVPVLGLSGVSELIHFLPFKEDVKRQVLPYSQDKIMTGHQVADQLITSLSLYEQIDILEENNINKENIMIDNNKKVEARTLAGFRDLLPAVAMQKQDMLVTVSSVFRAFGFAPIETPHIEYADVLVGQGSDEIQKELYRFEDHGGRDVALRFDQTIPLSRFTVEHLRQQTIQLPFKRYAMGNVFRGERAQKGRYREFTQCDFDFIGTTSIGSDAEIVQVIHDGLTSLGIEKFTISLNNRKIMNGLAEYLDASDQIEGILRIVDKVDKIGSDSVKTELMRELSLSEDVANEIMAFIAIREQDMPETFFTTIARYKEYNETMSTGIEELQNLYSILSTLDIDKFCYQTDFSIARGLGYYTGIVYETTLDNLPQMGSICSGGRYDNLTQSFSDESISGVGASIGIDRLIAALNELDLVQTKDTPSQVLIANMDDAYMANIYQLGSQLRSNGISAEVYPDTAKIGKQFKYADKKGHEYVLILGEKEIENKTYSLKNMHTGDQVTCSNLDELISTIH